MRANSRFRAGTIALLTQAVGELPRGTVVRVIEVIEGSEPPTYRVQPLDSAARNHDHSQPEPLGPVLTVEGTFLARSLPDFRSGITIVFP